MINKMNKGNLGKTGEKISKEVNQREKEAMKSMVKSKGTIEFKSVS